MRCLCLVWLVVVVLVIQLLWLKNCVLLLSQLTFGELGTRGRYVIDRLVVSRILFKVQFYEQDEIKDNRWSILYFEPIFPIKLTNDHAGSFEWKISRIRGNITCQNTVHFFFCKKTRQKNDHEFVLEFREYTKNTRSKKDFFSKI